jgi:hypothetical protein
MGVPHRGSGGGAAHVPGLSLALCHRVAGGEETWAGTPAVFGEIEMLASAQWPARMLVDRSAAECTVHSMPARWPQALPAAELGLERASKTGSALMQGVSANGILVALLGQAAGLCDARSIAFGAGCKAAAGAPGRALERRPEPEPGVHMRVDLAQW